MYGCGSWSWLSNDRLMVRLDVKLAIHDKRYAGRPRAVIMRTSLMGSVLLNAPEMSLPRREGRNDLVRFLKVRLLVHSWRRAWRASTADLPVMPLYWVLLMALTLIATSLRCVAMIFSISLLRFGSREIGL